MLRLRLKRVLELQLSFSEDIGLLSKIAVSIGVRRARYHQDLPCTPGRRRQYSSTSEQ